MGHQILDRAAFNSSAGYDRVAPGHATHPAVPLALGDCITLFQQVAVKLFKKGWLGWVRWLTPVIPAL